MLSSPSSTVQTKLPVSLTVIVASWIERIESVLMEQKIF